MIWGPCKIEIPEEGNYYFWLQDIQKPKNSSAVDIKSYEYVDGKLQMEFSSGSSMRVYLYESEK